MTLPAPPHPGPPSSTPPPVAVPASFPLPLPLPRLSALPSAKPRSHSSSRAHPHADAVLPRGSRVRITGNNRTKWDLIGRVGLVRTAQTLGGWHEVQLTDGAIVRVQRNALEVLELAAPDPAALVRIESAKQDAAAADRKGVAVRSLAALHGVAKKKLKKPVRAKHDRPHAALVGVMQPGAAFANFAKLNLASLRRYRSVYKLNVDKDCSKDELVGAVKTHFDKTKVDETEVISNFVRHIARRGGPAASD